MKVINLFAGAGVGKSVMAADIFSAMKKAGGSVELANEYAKDMVYEKRVNILDDQLYILAKQNRRLHRLRGQVDYVISDSPLLFSSVYAKTGYFNHFEALNLDVFNSYENINLLLRRSKSWGYQAAGRVEDSAQAQAMDEKIKSFLDGYQIPYTIVRPDQDVVDFHFVRHHILGQTFDVAA